MDCPEQSISFLANENIPLKSIFLIREAGYTIYSVSEIMAGSKDAVVLKYACENRLIILTFDRDYGELIYRHKSPIPEGIVFFRFVPLKSSEPAEILLQILKQKKVSFTRKFTVIEKDKIRQRHLCVKP